MTSFFAIFGYDFMIRAFIAGTITAVIAPVIGIFLVTRRYSFMADTLSHVSLAGVAIGYLTGTQPIIAAAAASAATALCVEQIRGDRQALGEAALALFLSGGLALAAVLLSASHGLNVDLSSVLFGSIATVNDTDIKIIAVFGVIVLAVIALLYRQLVAISFDEELAATSGIRVRAINRTFVVLTAITVSLSMRIVGTLLIGALMVIPAIAAMQWDLSFRRTLFVSIGISLFSVISGLLLSYQISLSSGGTIVLIAIAVFLLSALAKRVRTGQ